METEAVMTANPCSLTLQMMAKALLDSRLTRPRKVSSSKVKVWEEPPLTTSRRLLRPRLKESAATRDHSAPTSKDLTLDLR